MAPTHEEIAQMMRDVQIATRNKWLTMADYMTHDEQRQLCLRIAATYDTQEKTA